MFQDLYYRLHYLVTLNACGFIIDTSQFYEYLSGILPLQMQCTHMIRTHVSWWYEYFRLCVSRYLLLSLSLHTYLFNYFEQPYCNHEASWCTFSQFSQFHLFIIQNFIKASFEFVDPLYIFLAYGLVAQKLQHC